jgi:hypothetical protein
MPISVAIVRIAQLAKQARSVCAQPWTSPIRSYNVVSASRHHARVDWAETAMAEVGDRAGAASERQRNRPCA